VAGRTAGGVWVPSEGLETIEAIHHPQMASISRQMTSSTQPTETL
jgi:hypothetical protein